MGAAASAIEFAHSGIGTAFHPNAKALLDGEGAVVGFDTKSGGIDRGVKARHLAICVQGGCELFDTLPVSGSDCHGPRPHERHPQSVPGNGREIRRRSW